MGRAKRGELELKMSEFLSHWWKHEEFTITDICESTKICRLTLITPGGILSQLIHAGKIHKSSVGGLHGNTIFYRKGPAPKCEDKYPKLSPGLQPDIWNLFFAWKYRESDLESPSITPPERPSESRANESGRWIHIICDIYSARTCISTPIAVGSSMNGHSTIMWSPARGQRSGGVGN